MNKKLSRGSKFQQLLDKAVVRGICDSKAFENESIKSRFFDQSVIEELIRKKGLDLQELSVNFLYSDFRNFLGGDPSVRIVNIAYLLDSPLSDPCFSFEALQELVAAHPKNKVDLEALTKQAKTLRDLLVALTVSPKKKFDQEMRDLCLAEIRRGNPHLKSKSDSSIMRMRAEEVGISLEDLRADGREVGENVKVKTIISIAQEDFDSFMGM